MGATAVDKMTFGSNRGIRATYDATNLTDGIEEKEPKSRLNQQLSARRELGMSLKILADWWLCWRPKSTPSIVFWTQRIAR